MLKPFSSGALTAWKQQKKISLHFLVTPHAASMFGYGVHPLSTATEQSHQAEKEMQVQACDEEAEQ